ncbi:MAG: isoprenylcysteine carboxylmethyltransferase family protein [Alphaproteobacteria bacterium]|nr:isoprenylcysteine carboxylmethyltransferase family protein [Alphaproteobacteria bacterium]MBU0859295.1 isoprenylcysteine carboxylmethyltransferase family protein [Alphaproteobacteria bacterium]
MAKKLNKSRIALSRVMILMLLVVVFLTDSLIPMESGAHEVLDICGIVLISICALGRLYTTVFLGGFKNDMLVDYGPYSMVRNPLYFFSLLGFTGVALMSGHLVVMVGIPLGFIVLYNFLIRREEVFLRSHFGEPYEAYMRRVPRLFPAPNKYHVPDTVLCHPKFINKGFKDAVWWFAAFPLVELAEFVQEQGYIKPLIFLP